MKTKKIVINYIMNAYTLEGAIGVVRLKGYLYWSDEHHIIRPLDFLTTIFYAKYSTIAHDTFTFFVETAPTLTMKEKTYIKAENISGFVYRFPLS